MPYVRLAHAPQTRDQLWWVVKALFDVTIPRTRVCPDHCSPFDAFSDAYFRECTIDEERGPYPISRAIWHASRGLAGKSKTLSILGLTFGYIDGADITILGGSMAQSTNVHEYMVKGLASEAIQPGMTLDQTATKIMLGNDGRVRPLPASQRNVRGPHPSVLLCVAGWTLVPTPAGPQRIDQLVEGQTVGVSRDMRTGSWDTARRVVDQGYKPTIIVEFSDGTEITCTPDHRFATGRGWVEAQSLRADDVFTVWQRPVRPAPQHVGALREVLHGVETGSTYPLQELRWPDRRKGGPTLRDVSRLLGGEAEYSDVRGGPSLPRLRRADGHMGRQAVSGLLEQGARSQGGALRGLRPSAEVLNQQSMPAVPPQAHVVGQGGLSLRRSPGDRQGRCANVTGRGAGGRAARPLEGRLPTISALRAMGSRFHAGRDQDGDRGARGLLARSAERRGSRSSEAGQARGGRLSSAVLAHRPDAPVVARLRPGPPVRCWDITTETGNFFADGILVHNCDEVDEMELDIYDAALGQPMPQKNYLKQVVETMTVLSSTWQNAEGTLTEIFRRNEDSDNPDPIYRWCYKENLDTNNPPDLGRDGVTIIAPSTGWLSQKTIDEKRATVSAEMFRIEYDLGEPSIGNRAIDTDLLDKVFVGVEMPIWEKHEKDWDEWRFAEPVHNAVYVCGADWAKEQDKTVITVARIDNLKREIVYTARVSRTNYPRMVGLYNAALVKYNVGLNGAWHDSTGIGGVINDYLDIRARAFPMTGDKRTTLLSNYVNAIEKVTWRYPKMLKRYYTEHKFASTGDLYSTASEFHLPDTMCAGALCEHATRYVSVSAAPAVVNSGQPSRIQEMFAHRDEQTALADHGGLLERSESRVRINLVVG